MWYFLSPVWCQWAKKSWGVPQGCSFIVGLANPCLLFCWKGFVFSLPGMHFYFAAFVIFADHACLFICWNYFWPFVSSIIFSEINAGNMDIKSFIIILPLNYLAWRLVMKKYCVIIDLMGFKGWIFSFWYTNTHVHVCTKIPVSSTKIEFCLKLDNHLLTY